MAIKRVDTQKELESLLVLKLQPQNNTAEWLGNNVKMIKVFAPFPYPYFQRGMGHYLYFLHRI